ncbi:hypothetical protein MP638_003441 [Amoeboaphelidium occidentale]|nr:hypothetical protein MP638_003441 [Amoeboaphelidium occidentale]
MSARRLRAVCQVCGSRRFRPNDEGSYICHRGHRLEMAQEELQDDGGFDGTLGRAIRTRKDKSKEDGVSVEKDETMNETVHIYRVRLLQWILEKQAIAMRAIIPFHGASVSISDIVLYVLTKYTEVTKHDDLSYFDAPYISYVSLLIARAPLGPYDFMKLLLTNEIPFINILDDIPLKWREKFVKEKQQNVSSLVSGEAFYNRLTLLLPQLLDGVSPICLPLFPRKTYVLKIVSELQLPLEFCDRIDKVLNLMSVEMDYSTFKQKKHGLGLYQFPSLLIIGSLFIVIQLCADVNSVGFLDWIRSIEAVHEAFSIQLDLDSDLKRSLNTIQKLNFFNSLSTEHDSQWQDEISRVFDGILLDNQVIQSIPFKCDYGALISAPESMFKNNSSIYMLKPYAELSRFTSKPVIHNEHKISNFKFPEVELELPPRIALLIIVLSQYAGIKPRSFVKIVAKMQNELVCVMPSLLDRQS